VHSMVLWLAGLTGCPAPVEWAVVPTGVENGKGRDMGKRHSGRVIVAVTSFLVAAALAGCQQPTPSEKQARLLAAENIDLKQRLADQQEQIAALQHKHSEELQKRDQEAARCQARIEAMQKDLQKGIAERVGDVTTKVMDENAQLRKQVEQLQAEIEKLKARP